MKRILILLCALFALGWGMQAQVLSPNTEAFLLQPAATRQTFGTDSAAVPTHIEAFVEVEDDSATAALRSLGVIVYRERGGILTASIPVAILREAARVKGVKRIEMGSPVRPRMDRVRQLTGADILHKAQNGLRAFTGRDVVVGIIDGGFEYTHLAFYTEDGSQLRVKRVWNQNSRVGRSPQGYDYGSELTDPQEMRAARGDIYSTYHGTHVTGIAAGADHRSKYYGMAPEADIVMVAYSDNNVHIANAIEYIFDYAESVGKPCVINMSLGSHFGPHDGTSMLDRYIESATGPGRIVVGACGNEAEINLHAGKTFTAADTTLRTMLSFSNNANKRAVVDIWGSVGSNMKVKGVIVDNLKGRIVAETPVINTAALTGDVQMSFDATSTGANCSFTLVGQADNTNGRPNVYVQCEAREVMENRKLGIVVIGAPGESADMWNCTYENFINAGKASWTAGDNAYTVGEVGGTGRSIISVGSYDQKHQFTTLDGGTVTVDHMNAIGDISIFSSHGPTLDGRMKPDVTAPGMLVISAASQYVVVPDNATAATMDDSGNTYYYAYEAGTSMASPAVAGGIALWLEACPTLTPDEVRTLIGSSAMHDAFTGDAPGNVWGYGKFNAEAGIRNILTGIGQTTSALGLRMSYDPSSSLLRVYSGGTPVALHIYNMAGQPVLQRQGLADGSTVALSSLARGLYVVTIEGAGLRRTVKIVR